VTCLDENREPLPGIPAEEWEFTLIDPGAVYWYGDLSCTFTAVNPTTDEQGMLSFSITGDTAIVGDLGIQATIMGVSLQDTDILPCQSPDYFCDGSVQSGDFVLFGQDWTHDVPRSDFDWSSGPINALDFIFFGQHWGHHY
jgi:hypothetical protein